MQFPHLGQHCNQITCNRLDFLPMTCDACDKVFCSTHFNYDKHTCPNAHKKDVQVPICPLCGEPVPTAPGVAPDITVSQHIDKQCKSDTRKIFTNRCTYKGCKRKELIPVTCTQCHANFCLRHRHTADHECQVKSTSSSQNIFRNMSKADERAMAANAAEYRRSNKPNSLFDANPKPSVIAARAAAAAASSASSVQMQNIQGNMTEDEALARALALSIMELDETADRNRRNELAAAATINATPVQVGGRDAQNNANNSKDKCSLS